LGDLREIDTEAGTTQEDPVIVFSKRTVCIGAATVYECNVMANRGLNGLQKKKRMGELAAEFHNHTKDAIDESKSMADYVHSAIVALAKS
jgi:hypothetical protein